MWYFERPNTSAMSTRDATYWNATTTADSGSDDNDHLFALDDPGCHSVKQYLILSLEQIICQGSLWAGC